MGRNVGLIRDDVTTRLQIDAAAAITKQSSSVSSNEAAAWFQQTCCAKPDVRWGTVHDLTGSVWEQDSALSVRLGGVGKRCRVPTLVSIKVGRNSVLQDSVLRD